MNNIQHSTLPTTPDSEDLLFQRAVEIIANGRNRIVETIYSESTNSYLQIGKLISEVLLQGKDRAEYGKKTVKELSLKLSSRFGKGYSTSTLWDCVKFYEKVQSLTGQLNLDLSFTHYVYLMRLEDEEIIFYERLAKEQKLSVRKLERAVQSNTMLRLKGKNTIEQGTLQPRDIIKDPYILEFLGLDEIKEGQEGTLESKIIEHLEKFLLELGRGFAFVGRQYRITIDEQSYYADLVFYNIPLKCYVVVELKARKIAHQDLGQVLMYVNYFDREIKDANDNKTIGILLCTDKSDKMVQFTLPEDNTHIFASKYKLYLPSKEELQIKIKEIEDDSENETI